MKTKNGLEIEFAAINRLRKVGTKIQAMVHPIYSTREDGTIKKGNGLQWPTIFGKKKIWPKLKKILLINSANFPKSLPLNFKLGLQSARRVFNHPPGPQGPHKENPMTRVERFLKNLEKESAKKFNYDLNDPIAQQAYNRGVEAFGLGILAPGDDPEFKPFKFGTEKGLQCLKAYNDGTRAAYWKFQSATK